MLMVMIVIVMMVMVIMLILTFQKRHLALIVLAVRLAPFNSHAKELSNSVLELDHVIEVLERLALGVTLPDKPDARECRVWRHLFRHLIVSADTELDTVPREHSVPSSKDRWRGAALREQDHLIVLVAQPRVIDNRQAISNGLGNKACQSGCVGAPCVRDSLARKEEAEERNRHDFVADRNLLVLSRVECEKLGHVVNSVFCFAEGWERGVARRALAAKKHHQVRNRPVAVGDQLVELGGVDLAKGKKSEKKHSVAIWPEKNKGLNPGVVYNGG